MPLPQKVIDRLSREPATTPGWSGQLLLFSSALFLISLFVYAGVVFGYRPYYEKQRKALNNKIQTFTQQIPLPEQEKITSFYSQLANTKELLDKHVLLTPVFAWLEKNTHSNVFLKSLSIDVGGGQISFSATGKSLLDVQEQLAVLERSPDVQTMTITGVTAGEKGAWDFGGTFSLSPEFFANKTGL
ncbi:MAG: PilN domain-containing protein [Candidatus Liptonbacteria bacterium]|nr:PilN domain-containing protein [Candidatus Liptonbacteria bacterium]